MDDERTGSPWIAWSSGIIVLLGLYVGAYAHIVVPELVQVGSQPPMVFTCYWWYGYPRGPAVGEPFIGWVEKGFAPIHALDRRLRPSVWSPR